MNTRYLRGVLTGCAIALISTQTAATSIAGSSTGLASFDQLVTFGNNLYSADTAITNQFSASGVTFSGGLFYDASGSPAYANMFQSRLKNYSGGSCSTGECQTFSIFFSNPVSDAVFAAVTQASSSTFSAYLNNALVETFSAATGTTANNVYGFTGIVFDEIRIDPATTSNSAMLLDSVEYVSAVPVPAAVWLFGSGLLGLAGIARKKTV